MSRPLTDRERILALEAENARLRDELAAWRANESDDAEEERAALRLWGVAGVLRATGETASPKGAAKLLIHLLDHRGRLCRKRELFDLLAYGEETSLKIVDVRLCQLRAALRAMGFPDAIRTVWGEGVLLEADEATAIAERVEPAHG